jgi:hypothetical protein
MNNFDKICSWYEKQCDGNWEHDYGLSIESMDNPGWAVKIQLNETELDNKPFPTLESKDFRRLADDSDGTPWYQIQVQNNVFIAYCSPGKLEFVISIFLEYAGFNKSDS